METFLEIKYKKEDQGIQMLQRLNNSIESFYNEVLTFVLIFNLRISLVNTLPT